MVVPLFAPLAVAVGVKSALTQVRAGDFKVDIAGRSLTAEQIYTGVRGGVGNGDLVAAQIMMNELAERYVGRTVQLNVLVAKLGAAWEGHGAEAAVSHTAPLNRAFQEATRSLQQAKNALDDQVASFSVTYNGVEPVPSEPPRSGFLNDINPFATDIDRAIDEYNKNAANNVARYRTYNQESVANGNRMPTAYPPLPLAAPVIAVGDESSSGSIDTSAVDGVTGASNVVPPSPNVPDERTPNPAQFHPPLDFGRQGQVGEQLAGSDAGTTRTSQVTPVLPSTLDEPSSPARNPSVAGLTTGPVSSISSGPLTPRGSGAGRDVRSVRSPSGGANRDGVGDGRRATGWLGRGSGMGLGDATNAFRRDGVPSTGAPGSAGVGGISHGAPTSSRDADDIEHKSMLIQPDPDELFGIQDLTPPAVIGEDDGA